jgi:hypothetical protein
MAERRTTTAYRLAVTLLDAHFSLVRRQKREDGVLFDADWRLA